MLRETIVILNPSRPPWFPFADTPLDSIKNRKKKKIRFFLLRLLGADSGYVGTERKKIEMRSSFFRDDVIMKIISIGRKL